MIFKFISQVREPTGAKRNENIEHTRALLRVEGEAKKVMCWPRNPVRTVTMKCDNNARETRACFANFILYCRPRVRLT